MPKQLLKAIVDAAKREFGAGLLGVYLGGSRIRGGWRSTSDLDVHLVHGGVWQQKRFVGAGESGFGIAIDLAVDPLDALYSWVGKSRPYADFYQNAVIVYPDVVPIQLQFISQVASLTLLEAPPDGFETDYHYSRFRHLRRVVEYARSEVNDLDKSLAAAYALSELALFRLTLAGVHHISYHRIPSQLAQIDQVFARDFNACLEFDSPTSKLDCGSKLLESLRPNSDVMVGPKS